MINIIIIISITITITSIASITYYYYYYYYSQDRRTVITATVTTNLFQNPRWNLLNITRFTKQNVVTVAVATVAVVL